MLAETLQQVRLEQVAARKAQEGLTAAQIAALPNMGKMPSMFSLISKSIFGLTGIMSIAMVLMQIYGGDIIKFVGNLFKAKNSVDELAKSLAELNKSSLEKSVSDSEKLRKFAVDYNKASKEGNKERIADLEEIAQKEYGVHSDRLKQIGQNVNTWRNAFKEYLQIAKDTYFNEALAKKRSELEVQKEILEAKKAEWKKAYQEEAKAYGHIFSDEELENLFASGAGLFAKKQRKELIDEWNKTMTDIRSTNQIAYKNIYSDVEDIVEEHSERYRKAIIKDFDFEKLMNEATAKMMQEGVEKDIQELDNQLAERKKKIEDYINELKQKKTSLEEQLAQTKDPKKQQLIREDITRYSTEITETQAGQKDFEVKQAEQRESMIQDIKNKWHAKNLQSLATEKANEYKLMLDSHRKTIEEETRYQIELAKIKTDNAVEAKDAEIDVLKKRLLDIKDINSTEYKDVQNLISQHEATKIQIIKSGKEQEVNITQSGYEKQLQYIQQFQATEFERIVTTQRKKLEFELKQKEERLLSLKNETEEEKLIYAKLETDIALTQGAIAKLKLDNIKGYTSQFLSGISDIVSSINSMQTSNLENEKNKELAIAGDNAKAREEIEKDYAQKELDLKKKQANAAMGIAIAQAVATGALGIAEIWSHHAGIPFVGIPMATALTALLGGIMLAQIGAAVAQRNAVMSQTLDTSSSSSPKVEKTTVTEKFHTGGTNTAQTGVETPATLLGGESVNTIATTQMFSPLLSALNQLGGGKAITSGVANTGLGTDMLASAFSKALRNMPAPILIMEEFEKASEKHKKIQNNRIIR
jgi:hypothetical protein